MKNVRSEITVYAPAVTEDELVDALRATVADKDVPRPASQEAIAEAEAACGYALPPLLVRLLTEVANGGFGPRRGIYGVRGHNWYSAALFGDLTHAATEIAASSPSDWRYGSWLLPLMDWGCAITTWIDCRDPAGPLWGWDPNLCCLDHAMFPLDQTLAPMLRESLVDDYADPFYTGYFAGLRRAKAGCAPLQWQNGRVKAAGQDRFRRALPNC